MISLTYFCPFSQSQTGFPCSAKEFQILFACESENAGKQCESSSANANANPIICGNQKSESSDSKSESGNRNQQTQTDCKHFPRRANGNKNQRPAKPIRNYRGPRSSQGAPTRNHIKVEPDVQSGPGDGRPQNDFLKVGCPQTVTKSACEENRDL